LTVGKALPPSPGKINTCLDNKKNNNKIKKNPKEKVDTIVWLIGIRRRLNVLSVIEFNMYLKTSKIFLKCSYNPKIISKQFRRQKWLDRNKERI